MTNAKEMPPKREQGGGMGPLIQAMARKLPLPMAIRPMRSLRNSFLERNERTKV
jgi:hypothetical protein